ncbi:MAG: hypothetical protein CMJ19_07515 [Phycisphaeraceae bacterium]|mgnify:CR=1 FL=1|nr:hypothetical protein [Phycisphaeraceae bacterium]
MRRDYAETEDGDLLFKDGDLVIEESDEKHVFDIVLSVRGDWREFPLLGLDAVTYKHKVATQAEFERALKEELKKDGYQNVSIIFNGNGLSDFTIKTT